MNSTASTVCVCFVGIVIFCICIVSGLSCESRCGEAQGGCSCHATCESLQDCCVDYGQFCLKIAPYSASMLGGSTFMLLNVTFNPSQQLQCRFRGEVVTEGFVDPEGRGHCISPLLYETGWVPFDVSTDGASFRRSGEYLSVHPSKLEPASRLILVNASHWQHYGTADTARVLSMTWNPPVIGAERVDVELWGYREVDNNTETKGNRSASFRAEWTFLYSLGRDLPNNGSFSFIPRPSGAPHSDWRLGSVRVCASTHSVGARNVRAVWSGGHALAWHLEPAFRQDSAAWAWARCLEWDAQERSLPHFLEEVLDCPCTLAQARADTGRFHTDHGCDMEKGSVCTYHPGSVHCVRAIHASPRYGSGQQCCYDHTGNQVLTGDSIGGSTPDRAHDWGSPPYRDPPRVPGLSHWLHDVLSFYYCCLWSNHCQVYFSHRPSSGCRAYQPPRAGSVLGDPHFITFDGLGYSFNGRGEYQLVLSSHKELSIQGRTEQVRLQNGTLAQATMLSSVAMKEKTSDVIEVRLALKQDQLQVLRNQKVLSFSEQSWMDLRGVFLFSPTPHNVTVIFSSGVAVEVRHRMGTMAITVLLSPEFTNYTEGLLGQMNSDPDDDLLTSLGEVINPTNNSPEDLFKFGASWNIWKETSLFTYDTRHLQERYFYPPKHHSDFLPAFSAPEPPGDPLVAAMLDLCYGDGSQFCKFDTMTMQSLAAGNSTLRSYQEHQALLRDLEPVVSCGWLATPRNGQKEGTFYLQGATLKFSCQDGYQFYGSSERTCLEDGTWSGEQAYCLTNNVLGVVLGTAGCLTALITMVVMIKVHTSKQLRLYFSHQSACRDKDLEVNAQVSPPPPPPPAFSYPPVLSTPLSRSTGRSSSPAA